MGCQILCNNAFKNEVLEICFISSYLGGSSSTDSEEGSLSCFKKPKIQFQASCM